MNAKPAIAALMLLGGLPGAADGFYARGSVSAVSANALHFLSGDNDRPSRCDGYVNPQYAALHGPGSRRRAVDDWQNRFDGATGLGAGFALGVSFGGRRSAELEYAQGAADYDETSLIEDPSGVAFTDIFGAELPTAEERIGKLAMAAPFANVRLRLGSLGALEP